VCPEKCDDEAGLRDAPRDVLDVIVEAAILMNDQNGRNTPGFGEFTSRRPKNTLQ
jgi:hypothetical protein